MENPDSDCVMRKYYVVVVPPDARRVRSGRYTNYKDHLMRNMMVPRFDVPELISNQEDMKRFYELFHEVGHSVTLVTSRSHGVPGL